MATTAGLLLALATSAQAGRTSSAATNRLPVISVTVKAPSATSRIVHVVNRDTVVGSYFLIRAVDRPKIVSAVGPTGPCTVSESPFLIVTDKHIEYRAHCRFTLKPGRAVDFRLSTRGAGTVAAFVCPPKPTTFPCRS
ncbi:MAG TPA: hypothetical protein VJT84_02395 [Gaiellaceae bacterium]|nr:hypothetical protein [Gaiellaceae bacterium]